MVKEFQFLDEQEADMDGLQMALRVGGEFSNQEAMQLEGLVLDYLKVQSPLL